MDFCQIILTLSFEIYEVHFKQTNDENKRKWAQYSKFCIPLSIAIYRNNKQSGNRKINKATIEKNSIGVLM